MSKAKKPRTDHDCTLAELPPSVCILHVSGIKHGEFIALNNIRCPPQEKLEMLHDLREKRLLQPYGSPTRMEAVCMLIPESLEGVNLEITGYHRGCYQAFTKHQDRLKCTVPDDGPSTYRSPRKRSTAFTNVFPPECIFCEQLETKVSGRTERCVKFVSFKGKEAAWTHIESQALGIGDNRLHRKVAGEDLCAKQAHFHKSCHTSFKLRHVNHLRDQANGSFENKPDEKLEAHQSSFGKVLDFIRERVIALKEVVQLGTLRQLYILELERCGFPNQDYRSDKLKTRLQKHEINECIAFTKVTPGDKGCITYNLVYSTSISVAEAVTYAYRLGSKDKFKDVTLHLRSVVHGMFNDSTPLPWPPTADELDARQSEEYLPTDLIKFLKTLILGEADVEKSEKNRRLVLSVAQDICRAVTNGEWKLPKHILLCSTIRHLYRSKQLTNVLHRLGHCESYDFGLEIETALAEALNDASSSLTPQIATGEDNEVFHVEWDNLNKITTNVHDSNVVNSTGGIMIQEVKSSTNTANKVKTLHLAETTLSHTLSV